MRTTSKLLLCLFLALLGWACLVSDDLTGSYVLVTIEDQELPAPVPDTRFEVTNGSLQLSEDRSFVLSYATYDSTSVSGSFTAVLSGTYDSQDGPTVEFSSSELTIDGSPVSEPEEPFFGTVQGDSLTLTDPNDVRWMFRKIHQ